MSYKFYDKVAKKFGDYGSTGSKRTTEFLDEKPEGVFKERLLGVSGKDKVALDVGCADGRFTLSIAPNFKEIIAIDLSKGMLKAARTLQREKKVRNVKFEIQDAYKTTYKNASFDIVYSRRGPSSFPEAFRLLRPSGYFVEIDIGEKDCQEIKEIFGRGQDYGRWNNPRIVRDKRGLSKAGFMVLFAKEFFYNEFYSSYEDLDLFLQGAPIFEDFDSEKDRDLLEKYVAKFKTEKRIKLPRHRVVTVSKKPDGWQFIQAFTD